MDIFLDSNIYLSDMRMESNRFSSLFDYIRRTRSHLVLPALVRDEVVARHREKLVEQIRKTEKQFKELQRYSLDKLRLTSPVPKSETNALKRLLRAPAKGIRIKFYPDTDGVDVNEVIRRGINRIPPASRSGEELRDVMLWLIVLHYATSHRHAEVAFISGDNGFWDGDRVNEQIAKDITSVGGRIQVSRDVADFVRENALKSEPVSAAWAAERIDLSSLHQSLLSKTNGALQETGRLSGSVKSISLADIAFTEGVLYKVGEGVELAEIKYIGNFSVRTVLVLGQTSLFPEPIHALAGIQNSFAASLGKFGAGMTQTARESQVVKTEYLARAAILVSCRIVSTKADSEIDEVKIEDIRQI